MDLYTLNDSFLADQVIDEYVSAIWTERYSSAGDVQIVAPATEDNLAKLAEGTFLALRGTKEVMQLKTQNIENKLVTVIGESLVGFLNQRYSWNRNPAAGDVEDTARILDYTETTTPGEIIADVVDRMVITPIDYTGEYANVNLDWEKEAIPYLELGAVDSSGADKRLTVTTGPLYDAIRQVAEKEGVGISLYLDSADPVLGYVLKFTTYRGVDRTTGGTPPFIRLSPELDSLSDIKEIRSLAEYKNVAYVYYQGIITTHYAEPTLPIPEGFDRRVIVTDAEGEPVGRKVTYSHYSPNVGSWTQIVVGPTEIAAFREQHAKDVLANNNYIKAIDGQTSPQNDYKYGVDYGLGDIIELEGITGIISKARITEYIRSEDNTGEKEYPTISVIGDDDA